MTTVFLSCSRSDTRIAENIARTLSDLGIEYFQDIKDVHIGPKISDSVRKALRECLVVLVIVSPDSLKSGWVAYEIGYASALEKTVFQFFTHEDIEPPTYLADTHFGTMMGDIRTYFSRIDGVSNLLKRQEQKWRADIEASYLAWWEKENADRADGPAHVDGIEVFVPHGVFSPSVRLTFSAHMANRYMPDVAGKKVLDLGTGSGFLAIAAANKGASAVTAVDCDDGAVRCARDNVARHRLQQIVEVKKSDLFSGVSGRYDVILANLPISREVSAWGGLRKDIATTIHQCINGLEKHLKVSGVATLTWASFGPPNLIAEALTKSGFRSRTFEESTFGATWYIYEARRSDERNETVIGTSALQQTRSR